MGNCLAPIEFGKIDPQGWLGGRNHPPAGARVFSQGRKAGGQGLRRVAGADLAVAGGDLQTPAATYKSTLMANGAANVLRNIWANAVIFCGHFPDGAEKFTKTEG